VTIYISALEILLLTYLLSRKQVRAGENTTQRRRVQCGSFIL